MLAWSAALVVGGLVDPPARWLDRENRQLLFGCWREAKRYSCASTLRTDHKTYVGEDDSGSRLSCGKELLEELNDEAQQGYKRQINGYPFFLTVMRMVNLSTGFLNPWETVFL
jgi:hypothetical protein